MLRFSTNTSRGQTPPEVVVIAEVGVNHNGDADRAMSLIDAAAAAGADAVKFQCFDADALLSSDAVLAEYQQCQASDARAMLRGLQLGEGQWLTLRAHARSVGLAWIVTPFSVGDVATLEAMDVDAVKIASPDAVNPALLEASVSLGKPMLISTGTSELDELVPAATCLAAHMPGGALLQCVSCYPTAEANAALAGISVLEKRFGLPVGYSDHTQAIDTPALAVAAGACVIEKHLTYDRNAAGPDHAASLDPGQFEQMIQQVRRAQAMLGPAVKTCQSCEADVRKVARQSVCAAGDLPAGAVLGRDDLECRRPGTGIPAAQLGDVVGKRLARAVAAGAMLNWSDVQVGE